MKLNRVLVVFKRHIGGTGPGRAPPAALARWQLLHEDALTRVEEALGRLSVDHAVVDRNDIREGISGDLLVTVGGDGTVLAAAHVAGAIPLLGINSMPGHSVGFFCAAAARGAERVIAEIISGERRWRELPLLEAAIDGRPVPVRALNDVLFAGASPAEMVRYEIAAGGRRERQRSSGVWIAAGPGSTAAILAAGGRRQPIDSARLQYLVREPHCISGGRYRLGRGILPARATIAIVPEIGDGTIFLDGPKHAYPVPANARLTCRASRTRLRIFL